MKDRCDYCGEDYSFKADNDDTSLKILNEPMVYEIDDVSYHLECWVRKKWEDRGCKIVDKEKWNKLWAYLRHAASVADATSPSEWFEDWYEEELDYTPGGDWW